MRDDINRRSLLKSTGVSGIAALLGTGTAVGNPGKGNREDDDEGGKGQGRGREGPFDVIIGVDPGRAGEIRERAEEVYRELDFGDIGQAVSGRFTEEALRGLRNNPHIRYAEENGVMEALGETVPYGIEITDADLAIEEGFTGGSVSIAILDTGIDAQHETLVDNLGNGWAAAEAECDEFCDTGWLCPANDISTCHEEWDDDNDHGTHVAGTAAAAMNSTGVKGVAPDSTLHSVKVLDCCGSGSFDDIAAGIEWATDQECDVINMSLGGPESDVVNDACDYAAFHNVVLVAAAGNDGSDDSVGSPADHPEVIAVSATDENDDLADFSSTGPEVEIAAPGADVLSTVPRDDYEEYSGTSMAAPHVAGAAASVIASGITDRAEVRQMLRDGAEDIGLDGNEQGYGRLNVLNSVDEDGSGDDPDSDVIIDILTDPATDVGETTATLNGELVDFEATEEVEVWFEYGPVGTGLPESTASGDFDSSTAFSSDIAGLEDGTSYEFRAHGAADGVEETGGVQTFETDEDDDGTGGWCYVTTATHRNPQTLNTLRRFRDESMAATPIGRALVRLYYIIGPPIGETLQAHPESRTTCVTRRLIRFCASLGNTLQRSESRVKRASLGATLTLLYIVGLATAATGTVGIRLRESLSR